VVNAARHAQETKDPLKSLGASSLEAPSAIASLRQLWPDLPISFATIGDPDPRRPRSEHARSLWTYKSGRLWDRARGVLGTEARPAIAPPTTRTLDAVARVAAIAYSRERWRAECRTLADEVSNVDELLAAMVHPPPSASRQPWDWRFHVMTAAALALGHLSVAGRMLGTHPLVVLLDGPVDWTTTAAVIALGDLALREPRFRAPLSRELESRLEQPITPVWHRCFVQPARWLLLRLMDT
jgi:hypothetical protein